jgi:hypothetical protein
VRCRGEYPQLIGYVLFLLLLLVGSVVERGILDALVIGGDRPLMWRILGPLGKGMSKFVKGILYISGHGQVDIFV